MARAGKHPFDIPDRFLCLGKMLGEKATAIFLREKPVESPAVMRKDADIENIDDEQVARLGSLDTDRTAQKVHDREIDIADILGRIVVLDETAGPIITLNNKIRSRFDSCHHRNIRMPAVMNHIILVRGLREVYFDDGISHGGLLYSCGKRREKTGLDGEKTGNLGLIDFGARCCMNDPSAFEHKQTIDNVEGKA